jgi:hypothetical protein
VVYFSIKYILFSAGLKSNIDDLANISSLAEKKGSWQSSVNDATRTEKLTVIEQDAIQTGRVKANLTKYSIYH